MSEYELYHHGVKGMKWGVRRYQNKDGTLTAAGRKRQAKEDYKTAKASATEKYVNAKKNADSRYEKALAKKKAALDEINRKYDAKDAATDRYYKREIEKHQRDVDDAREEMNFWDDPDSDLYKEAFSRYTESSKLVRDLEVRRDAVNLTNKLARDNATLKVSELYSDASQKAHDARTADYAKANEIYKDSLKSAKKAYKETKKNGKKPSEGNVGTRTPMRKEKVAKAVTKGAEIASKAALYSTLDDVFYGGAGKRIAKEAVIQTGRAAVTAYTMARGGYDIKWYDKQGRRVG